MTSNHEKGSVHFSINIASLCPRIYLIIHECRNLDMTSNHEKGSVHFSINIASLCPKIYFQVLGRTNIKYTY